MTKQEEGRERGHVPRNEDPVAHFVFLEQATR